MKKLIFSLCALCFLSFSALSQQKLSGNIYTGWLFPYTDLTESDYLGYKPNLAVGAGMGYGILPDLRLRGDLVYGSMNGNNEIEYFETTILEPQLGLDVNVLGLLLNDFDAVKFNIQAGTGILFYTSRLYDKETGIRLVESPVRSQKALSPNSFVSYGANLGIKLTHKLDLNIGMTNRYVFDADYLDGRSSGEYSDHYGLAQIGFVYYLKSDRTPNTIEVEQNKYKQLSQKAESLEEIEKELESTKETVANLEMEQKEKDLRINRLEEELDSARMKQSVETITTREGAKTYTTPEAQEILGTPQYRIIVASLPTQRMAERWIERSSLDKGEMVIAYIENLDTYRVIYRSFDTYEAARKEHQKVKSSIKDAWIIRF